MSNKRETHTVTRQAVKAQIGLIRNNKQRRKAGEKPARAATWKLGGMTQAELNSLLADGTFDRDFKSGRKITLTLA